MIVPCVVGSDLNLRLGVGVDNQYYTETLLVNSRRPGTLYVGVSATLQVVDDCVSSLSLCSVANSRCW